MPKPILLKEFIKLVLETTGPQEPFTLVGPVKASKVAGDFEIYREFPLQVPPELVTQMGITPDELDGGVLMGEHTIDIDVKASYTRSRFKGSRWQPPDPDEFELENWIPVAINGVGLSDEDAKRLHDYLGGELTEREQEMVEEHERERDDEGPDYDPPEYD